MDKKPCKHGYVRSYATGEKISGCIYCGKSVEQIRRSTRRASFVRKLRHFFGMGQAK